MDNRVKKDWEEFWKDIVCDEAGKVNLEQVKKELSDFRFMIDQVPKVYSEVTGGRLSYPNYEAETVLTLFRDEFANKTWALEYLPDDWDDITADCETNEDYKKAIFQYLEIGANDNETY